MTSYKVGELPIPYISAGASPLGANKNPITPPEPPTPPTPAHGQTYVTTVNETGDEDGGIWYYEYHADYNEFALAEHIDELYAKQAGDSLVATFNGTDATVTVTVSQYDPEAGMHLIGLSGADDLLIVIGIVVSGSTHTLHYIEVDSPVEYSGGLVLSISDPA